MAGVNPRVKNSLHELYAATGARKGALPTLEATKKMSEEEFEERIDALTDDLVSWIDEAKKKAYEAGYRAALRGASAPVEIEPLFNGSAGAAQSALPAQTNVIIEAPAAAHYAAAPTAAPAAAVAPAVSSAFASRKPSNGGKAFDSASAAGGAENAELAAKLALLNDKLDEVDSALASIHEMQLDLQKTQEQVKRDVAAKLADVSASSREAAEYADGVREVASRMTDVSARLSDALEENARANAGANARAASIEFPSLDAVNEKLAELESKLDSFSESVASRELQKENSRLLESQGIELSSLKSALKKQLKSVRKASKRITRVSRGLEEVEGAVKRSGRKTARTVKRVAAELGAETKSAKRFAKKAKSKAAQAAEAAEAVKPAAKKIRKLARSAKTAKTSKAKR